jgi:hypothetical protein
MRRTASLAGCMMPRQRRRLERLAAKPYGIALVILAVLAFCVIVCNVALRIVS